MPHNFLVTESKSLVSLWLMTVSLCMLKVNMLQNAKIEDMWQYGSHFPYCDHWDAAENIKNLQFYFSSIFSGILHTFFFFNPVTGFCFWYHAAVVTHGQFYLGNICCYYLACALETSRVAVNLLSAVNSLRVCCSLEWLPLRRHLFAYEPCGNNSESPHLLCKMNLVPLTRPLLAPTGCVYRAGFHRQPPGRGGLAET